MLTNSSYDSQALVVFTSAAETTLKRLKESSSKIDFESDSLPEDYNIKECIARSSTSPHLGEESKQEKRGLSGLDSRRGLLGQSIF